jgi:hypothetical protein
MMELLINMIEIAKSMIEIVIYMMEIAKSMIAIAICMKEIMLFFNDLQGFNLLIVRAFTILSVVPCRGTATD